MEIQNFDLQYHILVFHRKMLYNNRIKSNPKKSRVKPNYDPTSVIQGVRDDTGCELDGSGFHPGQHPRHRVRSQA